jgi:type I restriction enzyme M protein
MSILSLLTVQHIMTSTAIVNKVLNFCHTLRDDGVGYGDYLEQQKELLAKKIRGYYEGL